MINTYTYGGYYRPRRKVTTVETFKYDAEGKITEKTVTTTTEVDEGYTPYGPYYTPFSSGGLINETDNTVRITKTYNTDTN